MSSPGPSPRSAASDSPIATRLTVVAFLVYAFFSHGHLTGSDEWGLLQTTEAIYYRANLAVGPGVHNYPGADGRSYSVFAVGQPLLAVPLYAAGEALGMLAGEARSAMLIGRTRAGNIDTAESPGIWAVSYFAPFVTALLLAAFYRFERALGVSQRNALACSIALGVGTYVGAHSVFFLRHTTESLAILGALRGFYVWGRGGQTRNLLVGCACTAVIPLIRVPAALAIGPLAVYLMWVLWHRDGWRRDVQERIRIAAAICVPVVICGAIHFATNQLRWGTWLGSPMLDQASDFVTPWGRGLQGLLISPGSSIFLYAPLLLLLPWLIPGFWRERRAECLVILSISALFLLVTAKFVYWHGLFSSPGPRMIFVAIPLLLLPIGSWLDSDKTGRRRRIVIALTALGAIVQLPIVAGRWSSVVELMNYTEIQPLYSFVFDFSASPVWGCWKSLLSGHIDLWLWSLWTGVEGREPARVAGILLVVAWGIGITLSVRSLRAEVRRIER